MRFQTMTSPHVLLDTSVGQVMRRTGGKADPKRTRELLLELLCPGPCRLGEVVSATRQQPLGQRVLDVRFAQDAHVGLYAETVGAQLDLRRALLAGNIQYVRILGEVIRRLQQQRGFTDARITA